MKNSFFVFTPTTKVQSDPMKISNPELELVNKLKQLNVKCFITVNFQRSN